MFFASFGTRHFGCFYEHKKNMYAFYCRSQKNVFHLSCNYNILKIWFLKDALELMMKALQPLAIVASPSRYSFACDALHKFKTPLFSDILCIYTTEGNHKFPPCPLFSNLTVNVYLMSFFHFNKIQLKIIRAAFIFLHSFQLYAC